MLNENAIQIKQHHQPSPYLRRYRLPQLSFSTFPSSNYPSNGDDFSPTETYKKLELIALKNQELVIFKKQNQQSNVLIDDNGTLSGRKKQQNSATKEFCWRGTPTPVQIDCAQKNNLSDKYSPEDQQNSFFTTEMMPVKNVIDQNQNVQTIVSVNKFPSNRCQQQKRQKLFCNKK